MLPYVETPVTLTLCCLNGSLNLRNYECRNQRRRSVTIALRGFLSDFMSSAKLLQMLQLLQLRLQQLRPHAAMEDEVAPPGFSFRRRRFSPEAWSAALRCATVSL